MVHAQVIKALYDYEPDPGKPHELGFHKGDFFHVISREDDEEWYEAANPSIPTARGLVPVAFFEVIGKQERQSAGSSRSIGSPQLPDSGVAMAPGGGGHARNPSASAVAGGKPKSSTGRGAMVYGIVVYDFAAERPDELDAKQGEAIIVIAQSNPEWFVAKPIGRLGGPGLIPVSFIEIKDMVTGETVKDPHAAVQKAGVPRVEEWKKLAADYKNSSISLGKFDGGAAQPGNTNSMHGSLAGSMDRMSMNKNNNAYTNGGGHGSQVWGYTPVHPPTGQGCANDARIPMASSSSAPHNRRC